MKNFTLILMLTAPLMTASSLSYAKQVPPNGLSEQPAIGTVSDTKRDIALELSRQYSHISSVLQSTINQYNLTIDAQQAFQLSGIDDRKLQDAELTIRAAKGLNIQNNNQLGERSNTEANLLQFRLADVSMLSDWQRGEAPLFAFEPDGNDTQWAHVEAYDLDGKIHLLDVYELPQRPVFVIGLDKQKMNQEGLAVMRNILTSGISLVPPQPHALSNQTISTTVIKQISMEDDQEPWVSGKAEIYAIVTGVNPSRMAPVLDVVDMPYLDYSDTQYFPNQIIIHWERYRWDAADLILMEHDDGTNYKELASALLLAAEQILKAIPNPDVQGYAIIATITNGLLSVMPDGWFTNDDDFVDVYYTLQEGDNYIHHSGAGANVKATFEPLMINQR
ncbi:DUF3103 family protein [Shewanella sp. VB17]|uniref:DUF3103 family protein n=1 Tax=Shewanella sp. VB17 TaxID=2739432 RepID=UPI001562F154|nr:DUF3103 family protein [Shewanella sp. VB17]NRD74082.1 DUF3103 family protein [Shewanella sp. VB17]